MSDYIDHNGERYVHESYLEIANANTKRRNERIRELEAQLAEALSLMDGYRTYWLLVNKQLAERDAQLKAAREALEKALEWRMAGEPDDYNRCVEESLAALDGEKKGDIDERN